MRLTTILQLMTRLRMSKATVPLPSAFAVCLSVALLSPLRFSRKILKCILITRKGVDWINLAQGRDQWWAVVNVVINHLVP